MRSRYQITDQPPLFEPKLNDRHVNPVKPGFVAKPDPWKYSSARNYRLKDDRLIGIDRLEERRTLVHPRSRFSPARAAMKSPR